MHFDPDGAVTKINGVWQRFHLVFDALQRLLSTPDRLLIVNLGNHDLELALPWVREHLARLLTNGDEGATARLLWVTDGTIEKHVRSILIKLALHESNDDHRRVLAVITFLQARSPRRRNHRTARWG